MLTLTTTAEALMLLELAENEVYRASFSLSPARQATAELQLQEARLALEIAEHNEPRQLARCA